MQSTGTGSAGHLQLSLAVAGVALGLVTSSSSAQVRRDTTVTDSTVSAIQKVVISAARNPSTTGGAAEVVIDPKALNITPAPVLQEVLRQIPLILVRQNSRGEMEISMRGSESRQVAVTLDGLPLTLGWDHRTDPSLIPMTGVQSVRLVRGLSSLLHGPNVLGGIVDVGVASSSLPQTPERELSIGTGIDMHGSQVASLVGGRTYRSSSGAALQVRGGAGYRNRDGITLARGVVDPASDGDLRTNTQQRQTDGFAALRYSTAGGSRMSLTVSGYDSERGVAPELHVEEPRLWRYPNQSRVLAILSAGSGVRATPLGHGSLDVSVGYNRGTTTILAYTDLAYSALDGTERGDERVSTGRMQISHTLPWNGTLRAAVTAGRVHYTEVLDSDPHNEYEQNLVSTGVELEFPLGTRLAVSGGVVNDAATTPETAGRTPLDRLSSWGWRGGASYMLFNDQARLHFSSSRRVRFPALRELYSGALNRFEPNPNLRPETLNGSEVGFSILGTPVGSHTFNFQAAAFYHDLDDGVVRTTLPDRKFFRVNRDHIRTGGLELFGSITPNDGGLSASMDLLIQNIKVEDKTAANGAREAEHQPEFRARAEVGAPLPFDARGVLAMRHTGAQYCVHPDSDELVKLGAQTVGDLAVQRTWRSGGGLLGTIRVVAALDNVSNSAVYDQCGLPQPGRTFRLGLQLF